MKKPLLLFICLTVFSLNIIHAQIIISQYYEGASNDKYLEITNRGSSTYDFGTNPLFIHLFNNANADNPASSSSNALFSLTGTLASGGTLLFKHSSASTPNYASSVATSTGSNGICNFNGDDLIILSTTSTSSSAWANRTDVIGNGSSWGGNTSFFRNMDAGPNLTYTPSEWTEVSNSTVDNANSSQSEYLGVHLTTILPVQLIYFSAFSDNENVLIHWETLSESNSEKMSVESSINGTDFENVGTVAGAGTTFEKQSYSLIDYSPANGRNYYRLKQVDFDGSYTYSKIISVNFGDAGQTKLYPTATDDFITLEFDANSNNEQEKNLTIYDLNGKIVWQNVLENVEEEQQRINVAELNPGQYFLRILSGNEMETLRFVKK